MSTFREIATKLIEQARDELAADGLLDDRAGALAGAMVDAATIAVQDWLRAEHLKSAFLDDTFDKLIKEAGKL